jgi:HlyD family secretion protein
MVIRRIVALCVLIVIVVAAAGVVVARNHNTDLTWSDLRDRLSLSSTTDTVAASGYLDARTVVVAAQAAATVRSVPATAGQSVNAGDALVHLESDAVLAGRDQAVGRVEAARARLAQLEAGASPSQLQGLGAAVDEAQLAADAADKAWSGAPAGLPPAAANAIQTQDDVAQASLRLALAQLALAQAGASPYQILAAEAGVAAAEAGYRGAALQVDQLTVTAPITGTVTQVLVSAGQNVSPGQPLAQVALLDPLKLVVYIAETDLSKVEVGQQVDVSVDSYSNTFSGTVVAIAQEAEFTPKSVQTKQDHENLVFAVEIRVPNERGDLRPGIPADATIDVG